MGEHLNFPAFVHLLDPQTVTHKSCRAETVLLLYVPILSL